MGTVTCSPLLAIMSNRFGMTLERRVQSIIRTRALPYLPTMNLTLTVKASGQAVADSGSQSKRHSRPGPGSCCHCNKKTWLLQLSMIASSELSPSHALLAIFQSLHHELW